MNDIKSVASFLFESGMLAKTPRTGFYLLGSGEQSVAEHLNRTAYVGYALGMLHGNVDVGKIMKMCLFHDFAESRVSDLNYVHQKYTDRFEDKAIADLAETLPFGDDLEGVVHEYHVRESIEAKLAKDADNLELLLSLKEQRDVGNPRTDEWIRLCLKRIKSDVGKQLAEAIISTDSDAWWFGDKDDEWWVSRGRA